MKRILAWNFINERIPLGNTSSESGKLLLKSGMLYTTVPLSVMRDRGLLHSIRAIDALRYACGSIVSLVDCGGVISTGKQELMCTKQCIVARADASRELRLWTCDCAECEMVYANIYDEICWSALDVSRGYANGTNTKKYLVEARTEIHDMLTYDGSPSKTTMAEGIAHIVLLYAMNDNAATAAQHTAYDASWNAEVATTMSIQNAGNAAGAKLAQYALDRVAAIDEMNAVLEEYLMEILK